MTEGDTAEATESRASVARFYMSVYLLIPRG